MLTLGLFSRDAKEVEVDNIVINGDFEAGTTGWDGITVTDGIAVTNGGEGWQTIAVIPGRQYAAGFDCDRLGKAPAFLIIDGAAHDSDGNELLRLDMAGTGMNSYSGTFTAVDEFASILLANGSDSCLWDNVYVTLLPEGIVTADDVPVTYKGEYVTYTP